MDIRKRKKDKIVVKPNEKTHEEIVERRPFDTWTDMDQLFDQFRTSLDSLFWHPAGSMLSTYENRTPAMDLADLGDKYEMNVEMPGIPKEDINIEVTPYGIEISADHENIEDEKGKNWLRQERSSTSFYRCLELPEELKTENVEAEMNHGVLTITLPKVEPKPKHESKKVKIK